MPKWSPVARFTAADVFVIGGGPSLKGFDWTLLRDEITIGVNSAYTLGAEIIKTCFFADKKFFDAFKQELEQYSANGGEVYSACECLAAFQDAPYIKILPRAHSGLHHEAVGFGGNSGCASVNLALILGARRVFLLGFDCRPPVGESHWHECYKDKVGAAWETRRPDLFAKFMRGWYDVHRDLPLKFPGCEVINLGPDSAIPFFPIHTFSQYLDS